MKNLFHETKKKGSSQPDFTSWAFVCNWGKELLIEYIYIYINTVLRKKDFTIHNYKSKIYICSYQLFFLYIVTNTKHIYTRFYY